MRAVPLPDGLKTSELARHGFTLPRPDGRIRHARYNSWRTQCARCDKWYKKTSRYGRERLWICDTCRRKLTRPA